MTAFGFLGNSCGHRLSRTEMCFCETAMISFDPVKNEAMPDMATSVGQGIWGKILEQVVTR